jgi:hypothetical protein
MEMTRTDVTDGIDDAIVIRCATDVTDATYEIPYATRIAIHVAIRVAINDATQDATQDATIAATQEVLKS